MNGAPDPFRFFRSFIFGETQHWGAAGSPLSVRWYSRLRVPQKAAYLPARFAFQLPPVLMLPSMVFPLT